jgi:hypothetical protein
MRVVTCVAAGGLCGFGLLSSAAGSPPFGREKTLSAAATPRLDLRAPMNYPRVIGAGDAPAFASAQPHSAIRRNDPDDYDRVLPPALGTAAANFRVMSPSQAFVGRVRREGLPFARLWESKSALLSIGLSPKGKPGLWLTQKVR